MTYRFEWDAVKASANVAKHGVTFEDARLVFYDSSAIRRIAARTGHGERRIVATGIVDGVTLSVVYTVRGEHIRIISARRASRSERREYRQNNAP